MQSASSQPVDDLAALKAAFRRPGTVPFPPDNAFSEQKRALGETLFHDTRLSVDGSFACVTCHDRGKGFADGKIQGRGVPGRALKRHTPTLWNLAWSAPVFWDGRARSLEEQVAGPIESPDEMALPIDTAVARLAADPAMVRAFAAAFPDAPRVDSGNLAKAIATYERTFVSPVTRFDRWIAGETGALSASEIAGFRLFTGKAGCGKCHSGFMFTDYAFHDIGLPGDDRGRGAVLRIEAAEHAFKTPGLRELGRSAPYMHDGSLATLPDVIRHYESGIVERPTLSKDLTRGLKLTDAERNSLVAFLAHADERGRTGAAHAIVPVASGPTAAAERVSHRLPGRQDVPSDPYCGRARQPPVDRQQRHAHPQCAGLSIPSSISIPAPRSRARRSKSPFRRTAASWCSAASIPRWSFMSRSAHRPDRRQGRHALQFDAAHAVISHWSLAGPFAILGSICPTLKGAQRV